MNKFVVCLVKIGRSVVRPFYPTKVYGERVIPNKKCLVVGNHVSGWDPLLYTMWTKNIISFVYKAEFSKSMFLKWVFDGLEFVPVRRGEVDMNATKCILRLLKNDQAVGLFPEGTRNPNVDCLQPFHTGAALFALKTKSPIRPFYIWDKTKFLRKNYMIIGDEFTLEEFYDKPIDRKTLEAATEVIKNKVDELRNRLNEMLSARGVKRRPRTKKEIEKIKAYNEKQRTLSKQLAVQKDARAGGEE
ncbi:MAG: 1-acyl-sn-glycerol-3-phosphate acyltransferase [Clostridiales bacterium]|nr:1-acyl-sn-glycerol-3-phosphate acyltransferase [Clostridiales bacterium]